ncbi:MAG: hypothetical protein ACKVS6_00420 [Planctomycetota bacterium]
MKPNSSWSLKQNDKAGTPKGLPQASNSSAAAGPSNQSLLERRICWFIYRAPERRATAPEIATGLSLDVEAVRASTKLMIRKAILRELPKTTERPHGGFMIGVKFIQESHQLSLGPDPAEL